MATTGERPTPRSIPNRGLEDGIVRILVDRIAELEQNWEDQANRVADLEDRLTLMESRDRSRGSGQRALDDVTVKALQFMETHHPMKFTALTLAENLGMEEGANERMGSRLRTLHRRGLIQRFSRDGRTDTWSALAPEDRKGVSDA